MFIQSEATRKSHFSTCEEDRPLFAQFWGNDPDTLLEACKYVEDQCDAVDINLGWPQGIARKGNYGSFLLEQTELVLSLVKKLHENLKIPVTCKIRCLRTEEETLDLCRKIEAAGWSVLTVHGRLKEHKKNLIGPASWEIIKKIKETLSIPVIANGGIRSLKDVEKCLEYTGCDGVMTSEAILEYPAFFDPTIHHIEQVMYEYVEFWEKYDENINTCKSHLYKSLYSGFKKHIDIRDNFTESRTYKAIKDVVKELAELRKDEDPESKIEWYHRYWKEHEEELAYTDMGYSEFISMMDQRWHNTKIASTKPEEDQIDGIGGLFDNDEEY